MAIYVDDKMIFSKDLNLISKLKQQLQGKYELTDLGEAHWILGMEIICDHEKKTIKLSQ